MKYSYLIFTIPMILSVLTGFAIVFVYFPLWLIRRYTWTKRRKMAGWFSLFGLIVCLLVVLKYAAAHTEISDAIWVWPVSIGLGALDPPGSATPIEALMIWGLSILGNVGLYGWLGLLVGSIGPQRKEAL